MTSYCLRTKCKPFFIKVSLGTFCFLIIYCPDFFVVLLVILIKLSIHDKTMRQWKHTNIKTRGVTFLNLNINMFFNVHLTFLNSYKNNERFTFIFVEAPFRLVCFIVLTCPNKCYFNCRPLFKYCQNTLFVFVPILQKLSVATSNSLSDSLLSLTSEESENNDCDYFVARKWGKYILTAWIVAVFPKLQDPPEWPIWWWWLLLLDLWNVWMLVHCTLHNQLNTYAARAPISNERCSNWLIHCDCSNCPNYLSKSTSLQLY